MEQKQMIEECEHQCKCAECKSKILRGEELIIIRYKSNYGLGRINICSVCIEKMYKELEKKKLKQAKVNRIAEII